MRSTRPLTVFALAGLISLLATPSHAGEKTGVQVEKHLATDKAKVDYLLFLPEGYGKDDKQWPVIVFLHGAGESGSDLNKVKKHGPPKIVEKKKDFPFIVVSPQAPDTKTGWKVDTLNALLDEIMAKYKVDPNRIYLTGLSMGGGGTWTWATANPERFAAIVPICGARNDPKQAAKLKDLPVWAFHGAKDSAVPLARTEKMVEALKAAGGNVKMEVYPNADHDSWTQTYNNPELYRWLLEQKRTGKS